jgi:hypothetical protein
MARTSIAASAGTYAILENKLGWAPESIDTILAGGEPKETVPTLRRSNTSAPAQGYALRPTNPNALSQVSTEELLLELQHLERPGRRPRPARRLAPAGLAAPWTPGIAPFLNAEPPARRPPQRWRIYEPAF